MSDKKFIDLPYEAQVAAIETLRNILCQSGCGSATKSEPATKLAQEVRDAFVSLYSTDAPESVSYNVELAIRDASIKASAPIRPES
ncbi:hypothetical protein H0I54_14835 [Yersinia kristensenii]|uniref:hypothetical protein n=1 Tax=Yersinia kristensenii TaxID=28152 RepID=UPI0011A81EFD|nr:hypothetical protein [Yersinia kristensenii]MBW5816847.1 hypothetical protein [Yersinia kristensenii]MBW5843084.1 hypothetical protein [Yersinia kristensenii]MDA5489496.1 hypothetical protein [Yersinia kristensenii]